MRLLKNVLVRLKENDMLHMQPLAGWEATLEGSKSSEMNDKSDV